MSYCQECRKLRQKKHNSLPSSKEYNSKRGKKFYSKNKEELLKKSKAWRNSIRELYGVSYNTLRKRTDIQYKLRQNIRKRLWQSVTKNIRTPNLLGCAIEELKNHLESKFEPWMNWSNYGKKWEIDHIKPLALFDLSDEKQLKLVSHYLNLQPLSIVQNRSKSDTYLGE